MPSNIPDSVAVVALGSNLGDSKAIFRQALGELKALSVAPIRRSSFWKTKPVDCPPGSPDFLNAVCILVPPLKETPETLLATLQAMEKDFGRRPKKVMNEARPLDLDLICFGHHRRRSPELTLPHPRAALRRFVLGPLAELEPNWVLPGRRLTVAELLGQLTA